MSILLDALRKSEEQRRLGSAPSIHASSEPQAVGNDASQQWVPLILIALSAIAMAWIGWQQYQRPEDGAPPSATAGVERAPAPASREPAAAGQAVPDGPAARSQPVTPARQSDTGRTPVEQFAGEDRAEQARSGPAAATQDDAKVQLSESVRALEGPDKKTGGDDRPVEPEPGLAAEVAALEPPAAGRPARDSARAGSGERRSESRGTEPISFWELPQGVRDNLPELHITVLVYADQPEERFLLVSGQRLVEQDEFQDGVVLDEIRRDGAVFVYRNYRFLVKG